VSDAIFILERNRTGATNTPGAASFAALVERHGRLLFRIALTVTRNAHDAEDAVQEAYLQVYRGQQWEKIEDERGYLARVVWRLAVRQKKPRLRERELVEDAPTLAPSPEQDLLDRQMEIWLHERIDALPEKMRQPLALAALGELKMVEIARILDLPEGTVRRRIHTARNILREKLAERGGR
jgi:RNA polymerase sigma-70 factor (ECF subfamily)